MSSVGDIRAEVAGLINDYQETSRALAVVIGETETMHARVVAVAEGAHSESAARAVEVLYRLVDELDGARNSAIEVIEGLREWVNSL